MGLWWGCRCGCSGVFGVVCGGSCGCGDCGDGCGADSCGGGCGRGCGRGLWWWCGGGVVVVVEEVAVLEKERGHIQNNEILLKAIFNKRALT